MSRIKGWLSLYAMILTATLLPAAGSSADPNVPSEAEAEPVRIPTSPAHVIRFQVTGPFQSDEAKAYQAALESARDRIIRGLREKKPHLSFKQRLTLGMAERYITKRSSDSEYIKPPIDKVMYATTLDLELRKEDQEELYKLMRLEEAQSRQAWIVQPFILAVVALLLVAGYFRLEEKTRGYYTYWLRTGAVLIFVGALAALVYFGRLHSSTLP